MNYLEDKLHTHCQEGNYDRIEKILEEGKVDVNVKDFWGWTFLMYACYKGFLKIAKLLLEYGAEVNAKDKNGKNAMDYAKRPYDEFVKLLEEHTKEHTND